MSERVLAKTEQAPHTVDQKTWWYREPKGGMTLIREERDWGFNLVRTMTYRFQVRAGRVELKLVSEIAHEKYPRG